MKSMNMSSATGRRPVVAAPTAMPMRPVSLIGVSMTRSAPKRPINPLVAPITPPQASSFCPAPPATSSPSTMTVGSCSIAWSSASLIACTNARLRLAMAPSSARIVYVDVGQKLRHARRWARLGEFHRFGDRFGHLVIESAQFAGRDLPVRHDALYEVVDRVTASADLLGLFLAA